MGRGQRENMNKSYENQRVTLKGLWVSFKKIGAQVLTLMPRNPRRGSS